MRGVRTIAAGTLAAAVAGVISYLSALAAGTPEVGTDAALTGLTVVILTGAATALDKFFREKGVYGTAG